MYTLIVAKEYKLQSDFLATTYSEHLTFLRLWQDILHNRNVREKIHEPQGPPHYRNLLSNIILVNPVKVGIFSMKSLTQEKNLWIKPMRAGGRQW